MYMYIYIHIYTHTQVKQTIKINKDTRNLPK